MLSLQSLSLIGTADEVLRGRSFVVRGSTVFSCCTVYTSSSRMFYSICSSLIWSISFVMYFVFVSIFESTNINIESKGVVSYCLMCHETALYFKKDTSEARN